MGTTIYYERGIKDTEKAIFSDGDYNAFFKRFSPQVFNEIRKPHNQFGQQTI